MTYWRVAFEQELAGTTCIFDMVYANTGLYGLMADAIEIAADAAAKLTGAVNAIQGTPMTNVAVHVAGDDNNTSYDLAVIGGGNIAATLDTMLPAYYPLVIRKNAGTTVLRPTLGVYNGNRPIKRGRLFLSGFTRDWVDADGIDYPTGGAALMDDLIDDLMTPITTSGGRVWSPAIIGLGLPELPPSPTYPAGKPARPGVGAPIVSMIPGKFTSLRSRKG